MCFLINCLSLSLDSEVSEGMDSFLCNWDLPEELKIMTREAWQFYIRMKLD